MQWNDAPLSPALKYLNNVFLTVLPGKSLTGKKILSVN
jgi:hypothetical protein